MLKESGLYDPTDGTPASCQMVLQQYGKVVKTVSTSYYAVSNIEFDPVLHAFVSIC